MYSRLLFILLLAFTSIWSADEVQFEVGLPRFSESQINRTRDGVAMNPLQLESPVDSGYVVGPGDFFELLFPTSSQVVQVSPEGKLTIIGVGVVEVAGKPLAQVKRDVVKLMAQRSTSSKVEVQLVQLRRLRVNISGAIAGSGQIVLEGSSRLSSAIRSAGGLLAVADRERVLLIRNNDTTVVRHDDLENGDLKADPLLESGDAIFIPFCDLSRTITLRTTDGVMTMPFKEGQSLQYYMRVGNFHRIREPGYNEVIVYSKDGQSKNISMDSARSLVLRLGDDVQFLFKKQYVYVGGATAVLGRLEFNPGWHALDYIAASGVSFITGSWDRVSLIRKGGRKNIDASNFEIEPGDYIEIPRSYYESVKDVTLFLASLLSVVATVLIIRNY